MQIQMNTDSSIEGSAGLTSWVETLVQSELERFAGQITRIEIHLSDVNGERGGGMDKRCMIEARMEGRPPRAVTDQAATIDAAVTGAAGKMKRALESDLGRLGR